MSRNLESVLARHSGSKTSDISRSHSDYNHNTNTECCDGQKTRDDLTDHTKSLGGATALQKYLLPSSSSQTTSIGASNGPPALKSGLGILAGHPGDVPLGTLPHAKNDTSGASTGMPFSNSSLMPYHPSLLPFYQHLASSSSIPPHLAMALVSGSSPYLTASAGSASPASGGHSIGSVCRDPLCRDPLCPTSHHLRNQQMLASATACGNGSWSAASSMLSQYSSALSLAMAHQRESMLSTIAQRQAIQAAAMGAVPPTHSGQGGGPPLPYICNWVSGMAFHCHIQYLQLFKLR